jgi:hypothetical protein
MTDRGDGGDGIANVGEDLDDESAPRGNVFSASVVDDDLAATAQRAGSRF